MQILQWLFKVANEPPRKTTLTPTSASSDHHPNHKKSTTDQTGKSNIKVVFNDCGSKWRFKKRPLTSKNFRAFTILCKVGIGKEYLYNTFNLRRLGSSRRRRYCCANSMKMMKKEDIIRGLSIGSHKNELVQDSGQVGNKVLPINEVTSSSTLNANGQCGDAERGEKTKGDRTKTISRMKELLRWAANAKNSARGGKYITRKVLQFRNRTSLKAVPDDDELSNESPKISFRWEVESCSATSSSVYSALSMSSSTRINDQTSNIASLNPSPLQDNNDRCGTARSGNWITTDSEFVVLEL